MIIKASQRSGAIALANHLMNLKDNDHVTLHDLRGFVADDLHGAMKEAEAIRKGCKRLKQHVFSVSLNPPEKAMVTVQDFEDALERLEKKLGLVNQPRATVFHEKEGRRHLHAVYSRVDMNNMRAINMAHFKRKLQDVSRELYRHHGWRMPNGLVRGKASDPFNFTLEEWQQAKRAKVDPKIVKQVFRECWDTSDGLHAFTKALERRGYILATGDKRGLVAVDWRGEVYSISRWTRQRAKDVRARLGDGSDLPSVYAAKAQISRRLGATLRRRLDEFREKSQAAGREIYDRRSELRTRQRIDRQFLRTKQAEEFKREAQRRAARLPKGLNALWFRITSTYSRIFHNNFREATDISEWHLVEMQRLVERQLRERSRLQSELIMLREHSQLLGSDFELYLLKALTHQKAPRRFGRDLDRKRETRER